MPAVEDVGLLTGSKLGDSIKRLSSVDGDAAAKEDMDALTASKGDMASKSRLTSETPNERQVTSSQMVSEPDDAAVGDHDILTPSGGLMSAIATGDVTALEDDDALTASKGEVQKAVNSSVADAAAVEDEGVMTASKGQMTTAAGVLSATDAAASEDEVFLAASKGHVTKVSAADLPAIEDEGHLAGSEGKVRASEGILSNADVAATEDERTLTGSADDVMKTLERPSWKAKPVAQSSSPADDNEPTESSAEMQTMPSWMTKPDEPWAPPSQQRLDENQQRDDEHQSQQHADR
jgi:hypothetical protein